MTTYTRRLHAERTDLIDAEYALRQTSDTLLHDLEALGDLEDQKRRTPQGDPRLVELAARIEEIAGRLLAGSQKQLALSQTASTKAEAGVGDPTATIATTLRNPTEILAEWRAAEQAAQAAEAGSVQQLEARTRADRLREEYRTAFDEVRRHLSG